MARLPVRPLDIPRLFAWGHEGVPGEVERVIRDAEYRAREARGERITGGWITFSGEGVAEVAKVQLAKLAGSRESSKRSQWNDTPAEARGWCYLLHAYCAKWGEPAPPALLTLTFSVLALAEGDPDEAIMAAIGIPKVRNMPALQEAAKLDGEADAQGKPLSARALAKMVKVSNPTIAEWRKLPNYVSRRQYVCAISGGPVDSSGVDWAAIHRQVAAERDRGAK